VLASSKIDRRSKTSEAIPLSGYVVFLAIATSGCLADLLSKHWVFQWLGLPRSHSPWWVWEPYVGIETTVNTGALFGMGAGNGRYFALLSILAAVGVVGWLFLGGAARDRWLTVALGAVTAGILGNLYDRLGLWVEPGIPTEWHSGVRDWILLRYGSFTWPNFNIADSLLVCGAGMLMWHAFGDSRQREVVKLRGPREKSPA
jgi:signal peptidase II